MAHDPSARGRSIPQVLRSAGLSGETSAGRLRRGGRRGVSMARTAGRRSSRSFALTRRLRALVRSRKPNSLQSRSRRLALAFHPSHRSSTWIRRYPLRRPGRGDLLDPLDQGSLRATLALVVAGRAVGPQHPAGSTDRDLPGGTGLIDALPPQHGPHRFLASTSRSMARSSARSASSFLSLPFPSSSCCRRFIAAGIGPASFFRQA